jgi:hypothetical protein
MLAIGIVVGVYLVRKRRTTSLVKRDVEDGYITEEQASKAYAR